MTAAGEVAVATALSVVGTPYVYGAAAGDTSCFDCSSLVQWAWRQAGTALPRAAIDQFQALLPLAMDDLRPGDLVFYDFHLAHGRRYRGVNHVVVYAGDGRVVEASSPARAVRVTSLVAKGRPSGAGRPGAEARAAPAWRYEVRRAHGLAVVPGGRSGWVAERGGGVIPVGDAPLLGPFGAPSRLAGIAGIPSGDGLWVADAAGRVVAVGAAPSGGGYWLVDASGRVSAFGGAPYRGHRRRGAASEPVVAMAASADGYWLADAGGGVTRIGDGTP